MRRIALASLFLTAGLCQAQYPYPAYQYPAYPYPTNQYHYAAYQHPTNQYPAYQQPYPTYQQPYVAYQYAPNPYPSPAYQYPATQYPYPAAQSPTPANQPPLVTLPTMPVYDAAAPHNADAPVIVPGSVGGESRRFLQSDRAFPGFVGPISNPVLSKDPRSLTEARALFVNNWFPEHNSVLGGGDVQIYGLQVRAALTERLSLIADKDGYASFSPRNLPHQTGWLDINLGLKYLLVRDVENQFLVSVGATYEPRTGESKVFQNQGDGLITGFGVVGKEFGNAHVLLNGGYQFALWDSQNSSFFYSQLHVDYQLFGWLSPLAEVNAFFYNSGGVKQPPGLGEGDGLINFGTQGSAGNTLVTVAAGLKAQVCPNLDVGVAYEVPLGRKDIIRNRLLAEMIFRY
jgi:hypothetical protein